MSIYSDPKIMSLLLNVLQLLSLKKKSQYLCSGRCWSEVLLKSSNVNNIIPPFSRNYSHTCPFWKSFSLIFLFPSVSELSRLRAGVFCVLVGSFILFDTCASYTFPLILIWSEGGHIQSQCSVTSGHSEYFACSTYFHFVLCCYLRHNYYLRLAKC